MVKILIGIAIGVVIVGGGWWYVTHKNASEAPTVPTQEQTTQETATPKPKPATPGASIGDENLVEFTCSGGKRITAVFARDIVGLTLSDGRQVELRQTESASGFRYLSTTGSIEFQSRGDVGFLIESGNTTYSNCSAS